MTSEQLTLLYNAVESVHSVLICADINHEIKCKMHWDTKKNEEECYTANENKSPATAEMAAQCCTTPIACISFVRSYKS